MFLFHILLLSLSADIISSKQDNISTKLGGDDHGVESGKEILTGEPKYKVNKISSPPQFDEGAKMQILHEKKLINSENVFLDKKENVATKELLKRHERIAANASQEYKFQGKQNSMFHKADTQATKGQRNAFQNHESKSQKENHRRKRKKRSQFSEWAISQAEAVEIFDEYYKCLKKKLQMLRTPQHSITPLITQIGQTVNMKCLICTRPDQDRGMIPISWQFLRRSDSSLSVLHAGEKYRIKDDWTLVIRGVDMGDVGQYYCTEGGEYMAVFQLDVLVAERRKVVKETEKSKLLKPKNLIKNNLRLFTSWSSWSQCNVCGKVGQRRKIGLCMVKKMIPAQPVDPDFPLMDLYKNGLPCRSTALPKTIARLRKIRTRQSETLMGPCEVPCPTMPPPINITDSSGKVIEVIEPGFFSVHTKPKLPPVVKRKVEYHEAGIHLVLKCPCDDDTKEQVIVRWQRGKRKIDSLTIRRQTRGRVYIDQLNKLHIKKLLIADTAPYNCWIQTRHVATIKVIVIERFDENLKDYISYGGFILTCIAVVLTCLCVCCRRARKSAR